VDIYTQAMLKVIDTGFDMNSSASRFKLENGNIDVIFFQWCFDVLIELNNSVLFHILISKKLYEIAA